jgi:hypothetical protein
LKLEKIRKAPKPPIPNRRWRAQDLRRLRDKLLRGGYPRLELSLIVASTAASGLGASWSLLASGLDAMGWRYLAAVGIAYAIFLLLLRAWVWWRTTSERAEPGDPSGVDFDIDVGDRPSPRDDAIVDGGDFGGGGASGDFDVPADLDADGPDAGGLIDAAGEAGGNLLGGAADAAGGDEVGCLFVVVAAIVIAVLAVATGLIGFTVLTTVWAAPTLLAELVLDVLLAAGLYRRLRRGAGRWWLETALRRTVVPFLVTAALVAGAGFALQALVPSAHTLGEAIDGLRK